MNVPSTDSRARSSTLLNFMVTMSYFLTQEARHSTQAIRLLLISKAARRTHHLMLENVIQDAFLCSKAKHQQTTRYRFQGVTAKEL